jgi:uroporphyrinogen-III decarboxylase
MNSRQRVITSLNHQPPDRIPIDMGSTGVTGIHVLAVERLRNHFGLEKKPVRVIEPYQMLGEVEEDLKEALGIDVIGLNPKKNMFGIDNNGDLKEFKTFWGQVVMVPSGFNTTTDEQGNLLIHPEGDVQAPASGKMPKASYFFDAIIRQDPIQEENLNPADNLEEFNEITEADLSYWKTETDKIKDTDKAVVANFGGTAVGDIALVPAMNLKHPKGIRDIAEWYMSVIMRPDYIHEVFNRQTDIAIKNLERLYKVVKDHIDIIFICGTDFGTQDSQFCGVDTLEEMYLPYYKKMNDWIHAHTGWKTFKHSCGAVEPFIGKFIEAGFDILNPVQINAKGMDPSYLKKTYGDQITFWGGGVDTQKVLAFGSPSEVKNQVKENLRIFGEKGGFVFNTVHNIQANVPLENMVAMFETIHQYNKRTV